MKNFLVFIFILSSITSFANGANEPTEIDSLKHLLKGTKDDGEKSSLLIELAWSELDNQNAEEALRLCRESLRYAKKSGDFQLISDSYSNITGLNTRSGRSLQAIENSLNAIDYFERKGKSEYTKLYYSAISVEFFDHEDYENSMVYDKKALVSAQKHNQPKYPILHNIGVNLIFSKRYSEGIKLLKETLANGEEGQDHFETIHPSAGINIARGYIGLNELDSAQFYIDKFKPLISPGAQRTYLKINIILTQAEVYFMRGDMVNARKHALQALQMAKKTNNYKLELRCLRFLSQNDELNDSKKTTMAYLNRIAVIGDSISSKKITSIINSTIDNFELKKEKQRLEQIRVSQLIELEKEENQKRIILLMLVILSLVLIILFSVIQYRKKKNAALHQQLEREKDRIAFDLEKKEAELINNTVRLTNMNELIASIEKEVKNNKDSLNEKIVPIMNQLIRKIKGTSHANIWEELEIRFSNTHNEFYKKICEDFPNLSQNERRLCIFMKLNLTSKEISEITGQSTNSIVVARVRLRKKLGITNSETSLSEFISGYN